MSPDTPKNAGAPAEHEEIYIFLHEIYSCHECGAVLAKCACAPGACSRLERSIRCQDCAAREMRRAV